MAGPSRSGCFGKVRVDDATLAHVSFWRLSDMVMVRGYRTSSSGSQPRQARGGSDWSARIAAMIPVEGASLPSPGTLVNVELLETPEEGWKGPARVIAIRTQVRIGPQRPVAVIIEVAGAGELEAVVKV